jgi:hypothetical protein
MNFIGIEYVGSSFISRDKIVKIESSSVSQKIGTLTFDKLIVTIHLRIQDISMLISLYSLGSGYLGFCTYIVKRPH